MMMTRRTRRRSALLWGLVLGAFLGLLFPIRHRLVMDGPLGELKILFGAGRTAYSEGYSDSSFMNIERGMAKERVLALLGEPLTRELVLHTPTERWRYSTHIGGGGHRDRSVLFQGDRVVKVVAEFRIHYDEYPVVSQ